MDAFSGSVHLGNCHGVLWNVVSAELKGLAFPKVSGEPYVVLNVPALNDGQLSWTNTGAPRGGH